MEAEAYGAFDGGQGSELLRGIWHWDDDARRVRTRVPAEDARVWIETDGERVSTAIVVNMRLAILQSAAYGFAVPVALADGRPVCEFALAFSRVDHSISHFHRAWDEVFSDLRAEGFGDGLATCARRLLPLYQRMGARVVEEAQIRGEKRYFLHFDLARTSRWNTRLVDHPGNRRPAVEGDGSQDAPLAFARHETLVVLARLRLVMEIARGNPDPAVGIEARRRGAHHVLATVRHALAANGIPPEGDMRRDAFARARSDADDAGALWEAVALFAELAQLPTHESAPTAAGTHATAATEAAIEALDALILALVELWDGDGNRDDARLLARVATDGLDAGHADANVAHLGPLARPFIDASAAIARLASRAASDMP